MKITKFSGPCSDYSQSSDRSKNIKRKVILLARLNKNQEEMKNEMRLSIKPPPFLLMILYTSFIFDSICFSFSFI